MMSPECLNAWLSYQHEWGPQPAQSAGIFKAGWQAGSDHSHDNAVAVVRMVLEAAGVPDDGARRVLATLEREPR